MSRRDITTRIRSTFIEKRKLYMYAYNTNMSRISRINTLSESFQADIYEILYVGDM